MTTCPHAPDRKCPAFVECLHIGECRFVPPRVPKPASVAAPANATVTGLVADLRDFAAMSRVPADAPTFLRCVADQLERQQAALKSIARNAAVTTVRGETLSVPARSALAGLRDEAQRAMRQP